jgi:predicted nucleotidyltransferase
MEGFLAHFCLKTARFSDLSHFLSKFFQEMKKIFHVMKEIMAFKWQSANSYNYPSLN